MCPQGMIDRATPVLAAPTAPKRPDLVVPLTGDPVYDKVGDLIALARVWFRSLNVSFSAAELIQAADLMLRAEREARDEGKRAAWEQREDIRPEPPVPGPSAIADKPNPPAPAPGRARRPVKPAAKKEPSP
jgi:hypothetical protein